MLPTMTTDDESSLQHAARRWRFAAVVWQCNDGRIVGRASWAPGEREFGLYRAQVVAEAANVTDAID